MIDLIVIGGILYIVGLGSLYVAKQLDEKRNRGLKNMQKKLVLFICLFWHWAFLLPPLFYDWITIGMFRFDLILFSSALSFCWYLFLLGIDEASKLVK